MVRQEQTLVMLVRVVDAIPLPRPASPREHGHRVVYPERLFRNGVVVMSIKRLTTSDALLAVLAQPTPEMAVLRPLSAKDGQCPSRWTGEPWWHNAIRPSGIASQRQPDDRDARLASISRARLVASRRPPRDDSATRTTLLAAPEARAARRGHDHTGQGQQAAPAKHLTQYEDADHRGDGWLRAHQHAEDMGRQPLERRMLQ